MYCSNCGEKASENARFCAGCGQLLGTLTCRSISPSKPQGTKRKFTPGMTRERTEHWKATAAVHLKVGVIKREPWVFWIDPQNCALIRIDRKHYPDLGYGGTLKSEEAEKNFHCCAQELTANPIEKVLKEHPGSICMETAKIRQMVIYITYDDELDRYDDYERFMIDTPGGKFRGGFVPRSNLEHLEKTLSSLLRNRFRCITMTGFPFM